MFLDKLNQVLASERSYIADPYTSVSFVASMIINIVHWLILYAKIKPTQTHILLHYNVISGLRLVDKGWYVYFIPLLALILLLLNVAVGSIFYKKEKLAAYFLNISSIAVQLIFLIASIVLIIANA